jgi:hypothetical protein
MKRVHQAILTGWNKYVSEEQRVKQKEGWLAFAKRQGFAQLIQKILESDCDAVLPVGRIMSN